MRSDGICKRDYGFANVAVLLSVVCLAIMTWAQLAVAGVPRWGAVASVAGMVFFGLSTLTQCQRRAALMRLLTGTWIFASPLLFGFSQVAPTFWGYLAVGVFTSAMSLRRTAAMGGLDEESGDDANAI